MSIVAGLIHDLDVLLLDEPLSGRDVNSGLPRRPIIERLFRPRQALSCSACTSSKWLSGCGRIIVLDNGTIIADSGTAELVRRVPGGTLEAVFRQPTRPDQADEGARAFPSGPPNGSGKSAPDGAPMSRPWTSLLEWWGIDPRGFAALTRAFVIMDLRGQHYAAATASKAHYVLSPLFIVVGQCLLSSAFCCAFLFARIDVFFFTFINHALSLLVLGTAVVVEFQEVALNPTDLAIIAPRPIAPRTYSASRLANLLFYFALIFTSLNLFPAIVGAGLRDAGPWFAPAYLASALSGNLAVLALLVLLLSAAPSSESLLAAKQVLSWTQIVTMMVLFYGGQMMLRRRQAPLPSRCGGPTRRTGRSTCRRRGWPDSWRAPPRSPALGSSVLSLCVPSWRRLRVWPSRSGSNGSTEPCSPWNSRLGPAGQCPLIGWAGWPALPPGG